MSCVHEVKNEFKVVQNPQMILLCEKAARGDSARCEQIRMLLPQRSQGSTLKNHMPLMANSTTVASQKDPVSPLHMASTSQTATSNWQAMTAQPRLQKIAACASQKQEADLLRGL